MAPRPIGPSLISPPPGSDANLPDWQSERLSTAFVAVLAIFLRQLGSFEYTPVVATSRPDRRRGGPCHPSERQRVRCRRTRSGVVENDPALGPDFARRHHPLKDGLEPIGSIGRAIHVRTAVQAKIDLALGAAGKACTRGRLRIGRNTRDPPRGEPMIRRGREPGIVPRLQHDRRVDLGPTSVQKSACPGLVKGQARRRLDQDWSEAVSQPAEIGGQVREQIFAVLQLAAVRDVTRRLDRETKVRRRGGGPALKSRDPVTAVEGGVDLHGAETAGVAFESAARDRKPVSHPCGNGPARRPDAQRDLAGGRAAGKAFRAHEASRRAAMPGVVGASSSAWVLEGGPSVL